MTPPTPTPQPWPNPSPEIYLRKAIEEAARRRKELTISAEMCLELSRAAEASSLPKPTIEERLARGERGIPKIPDSPETRHAKAALPKAVVTEPPRVTILPPMEFVLEEEFPSAPPTQALPEDEETFRCPECSMRSTGRKCKEKWCAKCKVQMTRESAARSPL